MIVISTLFKLDFNSMFWSQGKFFLEYKKKTITLENLLPKIT